jgi:hypothetical protein
MSEHVLQPVCKLERVDIAESELDVGIHDKLGETEDLSTQMERIAETRLLSLLGGERLDRLEIHVVVEVEVVEVLSVDEEVEHVVALSADLETCLDPVERRLLEKLGVLQAAEEVALGHGLGLAVVKSVQDVGFELGRVIGTATRSDHSSKTRSTPTHQLLVRHPDLDRLVWWAVL